MEIFAKPEARIQAALAALEPRQPCLLAFSGGLDSTVLLHALQRFRPDIPLRAAHVDHGLQAESRHWAQSCAGLCQQWGVEFVALKTSDNAPSSNLEAWAREQRYACLQGALQDGEILLTAHHLRDQAETLLLNLLRGSGLEGLAAMPPRRALGQHALLRPLLSIHPDDLQAYARAQRLPVIDDPSNADQAFDRNFLRQQILAPLEQRFPHALRNMARSAALLAEVGGMDEAVQAADRLPIAAFLDREPAENNRRLRAWLRQLGLPPPRHQMLDELWQQLLSAQSDAQPLVSWPGVELRRYREYLYAMQPLAALQDLHWSPLPASGRREWPWGGWLQWQLPQAQGWSIGTLRGGERLLWRGHHRRLKNLFQQAGIPPWQRQRMPVLWHKHQCLAVGDRWRADDAPELRFVWYAREPA